jgi:hypothetical protein
VVEYLPSKHETLSSNHSITKKRKKSKVMNLGMVIHAYDPSTQKKKKKIHTGFSSDHINFSPFKKYSCGQIQDGD